MASGVFDTAIIIRPHDGYDCEQLAMNAVGDLRSMYPEWDKFEWLISLVGRADGSARLRITVIDHGGVNSGAIFLGLLGLVIVAAMTWAYFI